MFLKEKLIPVGILEPVTGRTFLAFGNSNHTSDLIADVIEKWLQANQERLAAQGISELVINADNAPDCNSRRSQFLLRMTQLADKYALNIHLAYYPPYHSKYNPIEHYWGGLERSWNGFLLDSVETVLKRAGNFIWRGIKTQVDTAFGTYKTGIMHLQKEKKEIEERLLRVPELRWWDVSIPFRPKTVNQ